MTHVFTTVNFFLENADDALLFETGDDVLISRHSTDELAIIEDQSSRNRSAIMKSLLALLVAMLANKETLGFVSPSNPTSRISPQTSSLHANLITFDLDDTIFPVGPVVAGANKALFEHLKEIGCVTTQDEYQKTAKQIRVELAAENKAITYTELRKRTIRRELEKAMPNEQISNEIVNNSYEIWEEHRHIAAETHLYKDTVEMLKELKQRFPDAVVGAITNGKGNPLKMASIREYFDFCVSGEDEDVFPLRKPNEGIYKVALERYKGLSSKSTTECCWVHVGDDLANDVGASALCGAKAVWVDLDEDEYDQSASSRDPNKPQPAWSTATKEELEKRKKMDQEAQQYVSKRVTTLQMLPASIEEITQEEWVPVGRV